MNFQGLSEAQRRNLLKKVQEGKISLKQAGAMAKSLKTMDFVTLGCRPLALEVENWRKFLPRNTSKSGVSLLLC